MITLIPPQNQLAWLTYHLDASEGEPEDEGGDEGVEDSKVHSESRTQLVVTLEFTSCRVKSIANVTSSTDLPGSLVLGPMQTLPTLL